MEIEGSEEAIFLALFWREYCPGGVISLTKGEGLMAREQAALSSCMPPY